MITPNILFANDWLGLIDFLLTIENLYLFITAVTDYFVCLNSTIESQISRVNLIDCKYSSVDWLAHNVLFPVQPGY